MSIRFIINNYNTAPLQTNQNVNNRCKDEKETAFTKRSTEGINANSSINRHSHTKSVENYSLKDCIDYINLATNGSVLDDYYSKSEPNDILGKYVCSSSFGKSLSSVSKSETPTLVPNISSKCNFIESKSRLATKADNNLTQNKIELNLNEVPVDGIDKCLEGLNSFIKSSLRRMSSGGNNISINIQLSSNNHNSDEL